MNGTWVFCFHFAWDIFILSLNFHFLLPKEVMRAQKFGLGCQLSSLASTGICPGCNFINRFLEFMPDPFQPPDLTLLEIFLSLYVPPAPEIQCSSSQTCTL